MDEKERMEEKLKELARKYCEKVVGVSEDERYMLAMDAIMYAITSMNRIKGYLKALQNSDPKYFDTPYFLESTAEAMAELDTCIESLRHIWIKGEF